MSKLAWVLLGVLAFLVLGGGGTMAYQHYRQRGIRNNNPGNLKITAIAWNGKVPVSENTDGVFEQFRRPVDGIRALYKDIYGDIFRDGKNTVRKLITEYAPGTENNTGAYIDAVSRAIGKSPDAPITGGDMKALVKAIIQHENGVQPYPDILIDEAIAIA